MHEEVRRCTCGCKRRYCDECMATHRREGRLHAGGAEEFEAYLNGDEAFLAQVDRDEDWLGVTAEAQRRRMMEGSR